jgi:hypothetical protein
MCKIKYNIKKGNMYIYLKYKNKLKLINNNYLVFIAFVWVYNKWWYHTLL